MSNERTEKYKPESFPGPVSGQQALRNDSSLKDRAKETGKGEQIKGRN